MRFTIIIPAFNAEPTLGRCLDSVAHQTYGDFQAVIVDDGSTDGTGAMAAEYAHRDPRFHVVTIANVMTNIDVMKIAYIVIMMEWYLQKMK